LSSVSIIAADAHRHADVGLLQCRGVVHAVAGHRDHVPPGLQRGHDAQLVRRRHPRIDVDVPDFARELGVAHFLELRPGHHAPPLHQPQLARDRLRRRRVVAGDHHDADPRVLAFAHRGLGFGPRRIDHADEAE
jgi:hypothetical protein